MMAFSLYTYTLSPQAYSLPLLHAAANPSSTVQGVFLADPSPSSSASSGPAAATGSGRRPLEVLHAVPLVHAQTSLTPIIEAGLEHVEVYAKTKGWTIVGMYEVSEGKALGRAGKGLLTGLRKGWEGAFALTVDVAQLATGGNPYIMTTSNEPSKPLSPASAPLATPDPTATSRTLRLIREDKAHRLIKDWDDHLDDSSVEWLDNVKAREAILRRYT